MAQTWPITLQEKLSVVNFGIEYGDTTLRSEMDIGLAKVRNRYTKGVDLINGSIYADMDEVVIFESFYKDTLANGSLIFTFPDPITQVDTDFRFKGAPRITPLGGLEFSITFQWERLP